MTQEYVVERINRAAKYYVDIERGYCGMSLETIRIYLADTKNFDDNI